MLRMGTVLYFAQEVGCHCVMSIFGHVYLYSQSESGRLWLRLRRFKPSRSAGMLFLYCGCNMYVCPVITFIRLYSRWLYSR